MPKLIINKLGPVETCELECSQFMNFTGFQASGKSTIAKAIYYFRTIKDDIIELAKSQALDATPVYGAKSTLSIEHGITLRKALENYLREKFLRTFGSSWGMPNDMYMEYHFTKTCYVKISLENDSRYSTPNYIWITMSNELIRFLKANNHTLSVTPAVIYVLYKPIAEDDKEAVCAILRFLKRIYMRFLRILVLSSIFRQDAV